MLCSQQTCDVKPYLPSSLATALSAARSLLQPISIRAALSAYLRVTYCELISLGWEGGCESKNLKVSRV